MNTKLIVVAAMAAFAVSVYSADAQTNPVKSPKTRYVTFSPPEDIYSSVEVAPSFPGGVEELIKFLLKNIDAEKTVEQSRINLTFVIEKNGSLSHIHAIGLNDNSKAAQELIRVMRLTPKWEAGKQNGKLVRIRFSLPINLCYQSL